MRVKEKSPTKPVKRVKEESDDDDEPLSARSVLLVDFYVASIPLLFCILFLLSPFQQGCNSEKRPATREKVGRWA